MTCLVSARNLTKYYGNDVALDDVSFDLREGEITALLGRNGAGKSTTLSLLTGRLLPDAGHIEILGEPVSEDPAGLRRHIGFLAEGAPLFDDLTVTAQLSTVAGLRGLSSHNQKAALNAVIEQFELESVRQAQIDTLSKGFRRRVALAGACLGTPPILIMDEPTDGLDPFQKDRVLEQLRTSREGQALLISTHSLEEVSAICDRVLVLNAGRLLFDGSVTDLAATAPDLSLSQAFRQLIEAEEVAA